MTLLEALSSIKQHDVNVVVAPMAVPAELRAFCERGDMRSLADIDVRAMVPCDAPAQVVLQQARDMFAFLPSPALAEAAAADALALWQAFTALLPPFAEPCTLSMRVELVRDVSCPKFHMDNVALRAVRVYAGPGTEYARNEDVDRKALAALVGSLDPPRVANARIVPNGARIQRTPPEHVVVLKGAKMAGFHGAAVHRSPERSKDWEQRLILKIDTAAGEACDCCP